MSEARRVEERISNVRIRILGRLAPAFGLLLLALVAAVTWISAELRSREFGAHRAALEELLLIEIAREVDVLELALEQISRSPQTLEALRDGDSERLIELHRKRFARLKDRHGITHLYFNDAHRRNIVRVHKPQQSGGEIDRHTTREAERTGHVSHGLEIGLFGTLTLRVVAPVSIDGARVGYIEVGRDIERIIEQVRRVSAAQIFVIIRKEALSRDEWLSSPASVNRESEWERLPNHVLVGSEAPDPTAGTWLAEASRLSAPERAEIRIEAAGDGGLLAVFAVPVTDFTGRPVADLVSAVDASPWLQAYQRIFTFGVTGTLAALLLLVGLSWRLLGNLQRHLDASYRDEELVRTELEEQVEERSSALLREAEARRGLESELAQAQKIEAVGQLTGGIAHDFNNLLTVIAGNLELLKSKLSDDQLLDFAEDALASARRGAELTAQLLAFSRKQALQPRDFDLAALVDSTVKMLQRTLGETFAVDVDNGDRRWMCRADPTQMQTVILNLALNARDAMSAGGRLRFRLSHAEESFEGDEAREYVALSLQDAGTGMDEATMNRIFEPFFTTKEKGRGTGLGLSMVYGFARQSGGHVAVESALGEGTTVTIFLPRAERAEMAASDAAVSATGDNPTGSGQTILLVEDDPAVRQLISEMLRALGYVPTAAGDAGEALELTSHTRFDLLLTDVVLPVMSGPDLARELVTRQPDLKVIYASGYTEQMPLWSPDAGPATLLSKPFQRDDLARAIAAALG